ncbi:MAG: VOC family protein [Planctomycetales bacterium]|nr:VOC family protein [Planctomycetales bacterium]
MASNSDCALPEGWSRIAPALMYDDANAAIEWLCRVFGFHEAMVVRNEDGRVVHSQLVFGEAMIMVGQTGNALKPHFRSPQSLDGANTQSLCVVVSDVDAHHAHASAEGAAIATAPSTQDYGPGYWIDRTYEAIDLEGHRWWFLQRLARP